MLYAPKFMRSIAVFNHMQMLGVYTSAFHYITIIRFANQSFMPELPSAADLADDGRGAALLWQSRMRALA